MGGRCGGVCVAAGAGKDAAAAAVEDDHQCSAVVAAPESVY